MIKKVISIVLILFIFVLARCLTSKEAEEANPKEINRNQEWKESDYFNSENLPLIGVPNLLGFTHSESEKIHANKTQKYGWHFWGEKEKFTGALTIKGTHQETDEEIELANNYPLRGPNSGADYHAPTNMTFPESGLWKLDAYMNDNLFGSVYVTVYD